MSYTVEPKSSKDVERRSVGAIRLVDYRRKAVDGRVAYVRNTLSIYNKNFCNAAEFVTVVRLRVPGGMMRVVSSTCSRGRAPTRRAREGSPKSGFR